MSGKIGTSVVAGLVAGIVFGVMMQMMMAPTPDGGQMPMIAIYGVILGGVFAWLYYGAHRPAPLHA